jgi:hypothetical protein
VRSNILEKHPSSDVRVYVVWFDLMPSDSRVLVDRKVLNDHRVADHYDPNRLAGSWTRAHDMQLSGCISRVAALRCIHEVA